MKRITDSNYKAPLQVASPKVQKEEIKAPKKEPAKKVEKLSFIDPRFENSFLSFLKKLDVEQFPGQKSSLMQYQKYCKKARITEVLQLLQVYLDTQYKIDKKIITSQTLT